MGNKYLPKYAKFSEATTDVLNPNEITTGKMQRGADYVLNNDRLPVLELPGGETIDLNNPEIQKQLLGLREGQQLTIGREGDILTNSNNTWVSRNHVAIYKENGQLKIRDISSNGTTVAADASRVKTTELTNGQMVKNTAYEISEKSLPKVTLANSQTIDLRDYKNQIASLQDGQFITVGRSGDIRVAGDVISGQHLVIYRSNGQLKIKDISLNGTTVEMNSKNILSKIKDKINNIGGSLKSVELSAQENALLNRFRNNKAVAQAMSNPAEAKKIAARINKILNNPSIVSPELKNSIENGYINLGGLEDTIKCSVDNNVIDDIARLATEGDYIKKFSGNTSLQTVFANTPVGEVANLNGYLYVNNGRTMQQINMSEKTFRELFPPVTRFNTHQGAVGTCYLVSSLERLYSSPLGRAKIYSLIGEDSNGIYTVTHNSNGQKNYFKRWDRYNRHIQEEGGLAIIEQGYCKNSRQQALNFNPGETHIMEINAGGWSEQAMLGLIGEYPNVIRYNEDEMANAIRNYANNQAIIMNCGSKSKQGLTDRNALCQQYNIFAGHEYSIKGYDPVTDCVIISNPWHSGLTTKMPVSEFVKYFAEVSFFNLA